MLEFLATVRAGSLILLIVTSANLDLVCFTQLLSPKAKSAIRFTVSYHIATVPRSRGLRQFHSVVRATEKLPSATPHPQ